MVSPSFLGPGITRVAPHKTKTPGIGLFWRKTGHDPVVAMKYVNDGLMAPLIQNEKVTASQKTPLTTDMSHDLMAVREDGPETPSSSQDGITWSAQILEFEFPQNGSELESVAQELGIQLAQIPVPPWCSRLLCRYVIVDPMDWYQDRNEAKYKSARRVRDIILGYRRDPPGDCQPSKEDGGEDDIEGIVGRNVAPANEPNPPTACSDLTETGLTQIKRSQRDEFHRESEHRVAEQRIHVCMAPSGTAHFTRVPSQNK
ncbi:hypothetical protein DFS33DRAFT_1453449 [Desarmillaria ectypa]|nr:hypothetical protein DFS33DRAFT_1453449 [Desarmillaria ectypa]